MYLGPIYTVLHMASENPGVWKIIPISEFLNWPNSDLTISKQIVNLQPQAKFFSALKYTVTTAVMKVHGYEVLMKIKVEDLGNVHPGIKAFILLKIHKYIYKTNTGSGRQNVQSVDYYI